MKYPIIIKVVKHMHIFIQCAALYEILENMITPEINSFVIKKLCKKKLLFIFSLSYPIILYIMNKQFGKT
jgi:hypothetical protein